VEFSPGHDFLYDYRKGEAMEKNKQNKPAKGNGNTKQPDADTQGTADPQEHMKGPVSSFMQRVKDGADHNDNTEKEKQKHDHKKNATGGDFINK
jgi:hypothetical protein